MRALTGQPTYVCRAAEAQADKSISDALNRCVARVATSRHEIAVVEGDDTRSAEDTIEAPENPCGPDISSQTAKEC